MFSPISGCHITFCVDNQWGELYSYRRIIWSCTRTDEKERYPNAIDREGSLHEARGGTPIVDLSAESRLPNLQPAAPCSPYRPASSTSPRFHRAVRPT